MSEINNVIVRVKIAFLTNIDVNDVVDIDDFEETKILDNIGEQFRNEKFEANEYASISELKTDERYKKSEFKLLLQDIERKHSNISDNRIVFIADAEIRFSYHVYLATYWDPENDDFDDNFADAFDNLYNNIEKELKSLDKDLKLEMFDIDCNENVGNYYE